MPIDLVDEHEEFEYVADETVFLWRRLLLSEREELFARYQARGVLNDTAFRQAYVAQALTGWRNLTAHGRQVRFPGELSPDERYASVLFVVQHFPLQHGALLDGLYQAIMNPTQEQLLGNSLGFLTANGLLSRLMEPSTAVPSAAPNVPPVASPSPATMPVDA